MWFGLKCNSNINTYYKYIWKLLNLLNTKWRFSDNSKWIKVFEIGSIKTVYLFIKTCARETYM